MLAGITGNYTFVITLIIHRCVFYRNCCLQRLKNTRVLTHSCLASHKWDGLFKVTLNSDFQVYTQVFGINLFVLIRTTSWAILGVLFLVAVRVTHCCVPQNRNLADSVIYSILVLNKSMLGFIFSIYFFRECYLIIFKMCSISSFFKLCQKKILSHFSQPSHLWDARHERVGVFYIHSIP